jgi:uncharacterized protein YijF (DUF1287 family)
MKVVGLVVLLVLSGLILSCGNAGPQGTSETRPEDLPERPPINEILSEPIRKVLENAHQQLQTTPGYSQEYFVISYPGGDVPTGTGACTDVVIRAFRAAGVDLQKEVHEDMAANFNLYPRKWGLAKTDTNIDHRRVPNLQAFFSRKGKSLPVTHIAKEFQPGDVVTWDLDDRGTTHIGLVSNIWNDSTGHYLIIHNIGGGVHAEDRLFAWKVTGHFRYFE